MVICFKREESKWIKLKINFQKIEDIKNLIMGFQEKFAFIFMQPFFFFNYYYYYCHRIAPQVQFVSKEKCYAFDKLFYYWFVLFHYVVMYKPEWRKAKMSACLYLVLINFYKGDCLCIIQRMHTWSVFVYIYIYIFSKGRVCDSGSEYSDRASFSFNFGLRTVWRSHETHRGL